MKRREFIAASAMAGAYLGGKAPAARADDKSGSKPAVIGSGAHTYRCNHQWGELPSGFAWQTTHGVCVDEAGSVYITHQGHGKKPVDVVLVFDPAGKFVRSFGKEFYPGGHGIDVRKEGSEEFLYLSNVSPIRTVVKATLKGENVWTKTFPIEAKTYKDAKGYSPTNVAFAPDGGFFIADGYGSSYIHRYDKDAKYIKSFAGAGAELGKTRTPHGIWLDDRPGRKEPQLIVADRANARLQYFTLDGKHAGMIHDVLYPAHFDIRGDVLLVPDLHARVPLFDATNEPIVHLGDDLAWRKQVKTMKVRTNEAAWQNGKFVHPHDACFDKDGNIFVVEWVQTGRVTKLEKVA